MLYDTCCGEGLTPCSDAVGVFYSQSQIGEMILNNKLAYRSHIKLPDLYPQPIL